MNKFILLLVIITLPLLAIADKDISVSEMFGGPEAVLPEKETSHNAVAEQEKRCKELQKNVDSLKGKPQRRYVAAERYKLECLGD